jgi:putative hydrolase of HD superfamily
MRDHNAILDLLQETQALDRTPRTGYSLRGVPSAESISEHSFHVVFLTWVLSSTIQGLDRMKALEMALVHDIAEVRFGDLPVTASHYLPPGAKNGAESQAGQDILAPLPQALRDAFSEYMEGTSPEARFVKACDKLQLMIKVSVYEKWGVGDLADFWENPANFADEGFEQVQACFEALVRRRKELAQSS